MPVGLLIIKMQKQTAQSHKSGLANMNEQSTMFSGCLLLLLMRQQNVTLPQHQRRQMNNSLVENSPVQEWDHRSGTKGARSRKSAMALFRSKVFCCFVVVINADLK